MAITTVSLLFPMWLGATTALLVRTPDWIIFGADGMYNHPGAPSGTICKIHQSRTFFWASVGVYSDKGDIFNVPTLVYRADVKSDTLTGKMDVLDAIIRVPLIRHLKCLRIHEPEFYKLLIERRKIITVIFFDMSQDKSSYVADSFSVRVTASGLRIFRSERNLCPGSGCPVEPLSVWMDGEHDAIDAYLRKNGTRTNVSPEQFVRTMLRLEITDKPNTVGPPISILLIEKSGARWLQQGADCPDVRTSEKPKNPESNLPPAWGTLQPSNPNQEIHSPL